MLLYCCIVALLCCWLLVGCCLLVVGCCFGECITCVRPLRIRVQRSLANKKKHVQPEDVGLRMPQVALANPSPVLHRNISPIILMHTPCLGISMIPTGMILNPQSLPNTWPRLNPNFLVGLFLTPPPGPLIQLTPPPPLKQGISAGAPGSTRTILASSLPSATRSAA